MSGFRDTQNKFKECLPMKHRENHKTYPSARSLGGLRGAPEVASICLENVTGTIAQMNNFRNGEVCRQVCVYYMYKNMYV